MAELLRQTISFVAGAGTITTPRVNFLAGAPIIPSCEKISFPLYVAYKITAISIKCGTAVIDKLKLRRIQ